MLYSVRHTTRFQYASSITESLTEVRMRPRNTELQHCNLFRLHLKPPATAFHYTDYLGNVVHHFSQPGVHLELQIVAESEVMVTPPPPLPAALDATAWDQIDDAVAAGEHWEMSQPSAYTERTPRLDALAQELCVERRADPLTVLLELNAAIHRAFAYDATSTQVDSPIDDALRDRRGVCQDFTHIMLALTRNHLRLPARYVSGYLHHRRDDTSADGASHAWLEVFLPALGWVGFDPTNNILAGERHIQVAIGRDYADVPPTRGIYKGGSGSELSVSVRVRPLHNSGGGAGTADAPLDDGREPPVYRSTAQALQSSYTQAQQAAQQQQQQQQQ